jgi:hypothetical protein
VIFSWALKVLVMTQMIWHPEPQYRTDEERKKCRTSQANTSEKRALVLVPKKGLENPHESVYQDTGNWALSWHLASQEESLEWFAM